MKKKIWNILGIMILLVTLTACSNNQKLKEIATKINNCESVKNYKEYDYEIKAVSTKDKLIINTNTKEEKKKIEFQLKDNILENENLSIDDLMQVLIVIDGIGQTYGYEDGQLSQNFNAFSDEVSKYTLEKEGVELKIEEEKVSLKIDLSKRIPLIDMNKFYLKTDNFEIIKNIIMDNETGNQNGKSGNIAYDISVGEEESTIQIGQDEELSSSAYKSILSALEVMYSKEVADHFQEIYPDFKENKTEIDAFTIETNYKMEDQDNSMYKGTKIVLITIDNKKINNS